MVQCPGNCSYCSIGFAETLGCDKHIEILKLIEAEAAEEAAHHGEKNEEIDV